MINPYATTFMIATRQDYNPRPRLTAARNAKPAKRGFLFFGRKPVTDAK